MDFYLTLPASSAPGGTSSRFVTRLPETLRLSKDHHVIGLADIIFPASNFNVFKTLSYSVFAQNEDRVVVMLPIGNYTTPDSITQQLNNPGVAHQVNFRFDDIQKLIVVQIGGTATRVELEPALAYFLGFEKTVLQRSTMAQRSIDYSNNIHTMYIYCDAVDYSVVGNVKSNLLQCIPLPGPLEFGKMQSRSFNPVRYITPSCERIDSIYIELLDEFGHPLQFNFGSTVVTLHVKSIYS